MSYGKTAVVVGGTIISAAALGIVSGNLTGQSGPNAAVVAAVIPAVLSLAGGVVVAASIRSHNTVSAVQATAFIVVFCILFTVALNGAVEVRMEERDRVVKVAKETHFRELEKCSKVEYLINDNRKKLNLDVLPSEYFCKTPLW